MKIDIITDNSLIILSIKLILKTNQKTIELVEHFEKLKNLEQQKVKLKIYVSKKRKSLPRKRIIKKVL